MPQQRPDWCFHIQIVKYNKPFSDGEFIKECLLDATNILCPEQNNKFDSITLSRKTVVRRVEKISEDLTFQLQGSSFHFWWCSLALVESTNVQNTAQLLVFMCGINNSFKLFEELLSAESIKDTTTGLDIFNAVSSCIERAGLMSNKMASITTDGYSAVTVKKNIGLIKFINDRIKSEYSTT